MSFADREKYVEGGSGQVFYVWLDDDSGKWAVGAFVGGPEGVRTIGRFDSRADAENHLTKSGCRPRKG